MPHVIVKLYPGKSVQEKTSLAEAITRDVMTILGYGDESVSVGFEDVRAEAWRDEVYRPDIIAKDATLYKKPGYRM